MDPGVGSTTEHEEETEMQTHDTGTPGGGHADHGGGAASTPPGLASAEAGYAPRQRDDGSWVAEADLGHGGVNRAFADFSTDGTSLTQGSDVFVSGEFDPVPLPEPEAVGLLAMLLLHESDTAFIDPHGKLSTVAPQFQTTVLTHTIQPMAGSTPYIHGGNAPVILSILLILSATAWHTWARRGSNKRYQGFN